jgi:hypothetical protein
MSQTSFNSSRHKDSFGFIRSVLTGVTQFTDRAYRSMKVVLPHMANRDLLSYNVQLNHDKALGTNADGFHIHCIPIAAVTGTILIDYAWGWYSIDDTIPATLPNTGTATLNIAAADQYKHKVFDIITKMAPPTSESYSSFILIEITRNGGTYGNTNEIAILGADVHYITNRNGSINEYDDYGKLI